MGASKSIGFHSGYPARAALPALDLIAGQPRRYWLCYPLRHNALGSNGGASMRRATPPGTLGALTKTVCSQEIGGAGSCAGPPSCATRPRRSAHCRWPTDADFLLFLPVLKRPCISEPEIMPDEPIVGGEGACASVLSVTLVNSVEPCEAFVVADQAPRCARYRSPAVIPQRFGAIFFP